MLDHTKRMTRYNAWANERLYAHLSTVPDAHLRADCGLFFGSILATLNHILVADMIWLDRIDGTNEAPKDLAAVLHEDLQPLRSARESMDARLASFADELTSARLEQAFTYTPISDPSEVTSVLGPVLMHLFNHQTHHRGQCHAGLTVQGHDAPSMDLIYYLRDERMTQSA